VPRPMSAAMLEWSLTEARGTCTRYRPDGRATSMKSPHPTGQNLVRGDDVLVVAIPRSWNSPKEPTTYAILRIWL